MRLWLLSMLFISASNLASAENTTHEADGDHGHMSHQSMGITGSFPMQRFSIPSASRDW